MVKKIFIYYKLTQYYISILINILSTKKYKYCSWSIYEIFEEILEKKMIIDLKWKFRNFHKKKNDLKTSLKTIILNISKYTKILEIVYLIYFS